MVSTAFIGQLADTPALRLPTHGLDSLHTSQVTV